MGEDGLTPARRSLRLLLAARGFSLLGDLITPVAVAFAVLGPLHGGAAQIGIVLAADFAGGLVFLAAGGVLADRMSPTRLMITSDACSCLIQLMVAVLLAAGSMTLGLFAILLFVKGAVSAFFRPAAQSLLPRITGPEGLQRAQARLGTIAAAAAVAAPLCGGALVVSVGSAGAITVDALTFAISACLLARLPAAPQVAPNPDGAAPMLGELRQGWKELTARRWLWASIATAAVIEVLGSAPLVTVTPVVADQLYGGATGYSALVSALGAGGVIGGLVAGRLRVRRHVLVAHLLIPPSALAPLALIVKAPLAPALAAYALAGMCQTVFVVLWFTALGRAIPARVLGRVSAWDTVGSFAFRPAGHALGGVLAGAAGVAMVLVAGAAVFVACPLVLLLLVREVRAPLTALEKRVPVGAAGSS